MTAIVTEDGECVAQLCNDSVALNILTEVESTSSGTTPDNSDPVDNCFVSDHESNEGVGVLCTACLQPCEPSRKSLAVGRCVTCSALLCRACVFAHKFMLCFQGHTIMPLVSSKPSNRSSPDSESLTDITIEPKPANRFQPYLTTDDSSSSQDSLQPSQITCRVSVMANDTDNLCGHMNPFQQSQRTAYGEDGQTGGNIPLRSLLASLYLSGNDSNGLPDQLCDTASSNQKFMPRLIGVPSTFQQQQAAIRNSVSSTDSHSSPNLKSPVDKKEEALRNICQTIHHPVNESVSNQLTDQGPSDTLGPKSSFRTSNDLLIFLDKTAAALQAQHWKASLKIHEGFEYFREELCQRRQILTKVLDDAFEKEQRKLTELANEIRNGPSYTAQISHDVASKLDMLRSCEQITNQNVAIFDFVTDCAAIRRAVLDGCGQLKIRQLQDNIDNEKHVEWNSSDSGLLSSGYLSAMSLNQTGNQVSPFVYPNTGMQFPTSEYDSVKQLNPLCITSSTGMLGNLNSLFPANHPMSNTCTRGDLLSHWSTLSSDSACYWLQDPCWNSATEPYSLFPGTSNSFHQNPVDRRLINRVPEPVDIAPSIGCVGKANPIIDDFPLSPGRPQSMYSDIAQTTTTAQLCDSATPSVIGCCCGNRPLSSVRRQKMVYHCKFGEFGGLDGQFTEPSGVAVNMQSDIIVADTNNHRIQIFSQDGNYKFRFGECGKRDGQLLYPNRVAVFKLSGDIVVTERSPTHQVQIFNQNGMFVRKFGSTVLQHPRGVCVDPSGNIIVVECKVMRVFVFDRFGNAVSRFNCAKHLEFPNSVCANDKQEIFISDNRAHCVKVFSYDGRLIRTLGGEGITNFPIGVGLDAANNVLVADNHNNFNLTLFSNTGQLLAALESKVKHAQCFDAAIMDSSGSVVLSSKDYHIYVYRYMPVAFFPTGMPDLC